MKISARNQLKGTIRSIGYGEVNVEVTLEVAEGVNMAAILTKKACEDLKLEVGKEAYAIVKATHVMLGVE